ncbi:kinase-like protein [Cylindrobasidium torrendii FP15055 ss-10]|uniref:non-specific serine/threonine protein kinase n=1 Tax=Cylindrobasidium torrendii FP15055 ss-10 TaxID=1314674 RepID=A0A0D7B5E2_9AGAR|nr:kinase-like protein [Cylindrobasidium torrendii FP15055 ss-10]
MLLTIQSHISDGGFSRVYLAVVENSDKRVALKKAHITKYVKNSQLRHEAALLLHLRGHPSIPQVFAWGRSQYYEYLALEILGDSVSTVASNPDKPLTLANLVALICQMDLECRDQLDAIEHVHSRYITHADIKPGNFLFDQHSQDGRIRLIDFGLSIPNRDLVTLAHIPETEARSLRGTSRYASIPVHMHRICARRDDMESLAYTIVKLLRGSLPWHALDDHNAICRMKQAWSGPSLCAGYPSVFGEFVQYTRGIRFDEAPRYARWRAAFRSLVPSGSDSYVPTDATEPYVGKEFLKGDEGNLTGSGEDIRDAPHTDSSVGNSLPSSDDDWSPTSSWADPINIRNAHLVGDEQKAVRDSLEGFDEPPGRGTEFSSLSQRSAVQVVEVMEPL